MGYLLTKVQIDGTTIWDSSDSAAPTHLISWEYERTSGSEISELNMKVIQSTNDTVTLTVGKTISIWSGFSTSADTKIFEGFISEIEPDGGIIKITGKDKMWNLIKRNVNKVYESSGPQAGQISAIAEDLIETYGGLTADVVATGTGDTQTIDEFRCVHTDVFERLQALADAVRYQIWYDAVNDTVHFEPSGYVDSGQTLTVGTEIIGVPKWSNDTSKMVNDLRVDGAVSLTQIRKPSGTGYATIGTTTNFDTTGIVLDKTPENVELIMDSSTPPVTVKVGGTKDSTSGHFYYVDRENKTIMPTTGTTFPAENVIVNYTWYAPSPIHQFNQDSIDTYTKFEQQRTLSDIQTIADAEVRTDEILSKFSVPFLVGDIIVKATSTVGVGETVLIVDHINKPNIEKRLVVTKQVMKFPGSNQELTVGDEPIRLADWQIDVESRLKRIEETLTLSNQDLILELIDIQNNTTVKPMYRQILTRTLNGDGFILGHDDYSILGTSLLGDDSAVNSTYFLEHYKNIYTETFLDDDFESSTVGTWSGGSLTL
jgi:hypothetical protein